MKKKVPLNEARFALVFIIRTVINELHGIAKIQRDNKKSLYE